MSKSMNKQFLGLIVLITLSFNSLQAQYFNDVHARIYGYMNCSGNWIDYDLDGDTDLLLSGEKQATNNNSKHTNMFKNVDRNNKFPAVKTPLMNLGHSATDVGDYDNDGDEDILISGINSSGNYVTYLYRNNRTSGFQKIAANFVGVAKGEVRLDDYDRDGNIDVIICGETKGGNPVTYIYQNLENNKFRRLNIGLVGVKNGALDLGDYDNDGDLDIVISGQNSGGKAVTTLYRNEGRNKFVNSFASMIGVKLCDVKWGDYDHDGLLDVALIGETNDKKLVTRVYRNIGDGNFLGKSYNIVGVRNGSIAWGDYDHDADLDILLTGESHNGRIVSKVYRNDREGGFVDINTNLVPLYYSDGEFSDYDRDGDLDLFISGLTKDYNFIAKVYRNDNQLYANVDSKKDNVASRKWTQMRLPDETPKATYFFLISSCYCKPNDSYSDYGYHVYYSQVFKLDVPYDKSINYFGEIIINNDNWGVIKGAHFSKGHVSYKEAESTRQKMIKSYRDDDYNQHYVTF